MNHDIYYIWQVLYDKSDAGQYLRKYCHVSLALWHNYKWATSKILYVFGRDFIAPYFHTLFPDRFINITNMSHSQTVTLLSYMRLSYPSFREELKNAVDNDTIRGRRKINIANMYCLFEYCIPVVIIFIWFIPYNYLIIINHTWTKV